MDTSIHGLGKFINSDGCVLFTSCYIYKATLKSRLSTKCLHCMRYDCALFKAPLILLTISVSYK